MAENQEEKKDEVIDPDFEKAKKSMGSRVDPDPTPKVEEPTPTPEPKKEDITPDPVPPKKEEEPKPDVVPAEDTTIKKPNRPEAYIPMPKYLSEKQETERLLKEKDQQIADALKKVEDLTLIAGKKDGEQKDDDIEAFMAETGFDRSTVDGFLKLAEKRLLGPERIAAIETSQSILKEAQIEEAYTKEFDSIGAPELKKRFPTITDEQLAKAKSFIDQASHTKDYFDKPLDFVIYKHLTDIEKMFGDAPDNKDETPGVTKKTIEASRPGSGKPTSVTAKDFEGQTDFSLLNDMEPSERSALIKDFQGKTYSNFQQWVKSQSSGTEVMRNGQRVILK